MLPLFMCFQKKSGGDAHAAFVHRGRQIRPKMKAPCGSFKVLLLYLTSSSSIYAQYFLYTTLERDSL